jgi:hypothetical protein
MSLQVKFFLWISAAVLAVLLVSETARQRHDRNGLRDLSATSLKGGIAAAVEEQAAETKDVAGNIARAFVGVKEDNERVAETATVSKTIAQDIAGLNAAVGDIQQGGQEVQEKAVELSSLADQIKAMAGRFKVDDQSRSEDQLPPVSRRERSSAGVKRAYLAEIQG